MAAMRSQQPLLAQPQVANLLDLLVERRDLLLQALVARVLVIDPALDAGVDQPHDQQAEHHRHQRRDREVLLPFLALCGAPGNRLMRGISRSS
jgi:hypothetical protein